MSARGMLSPERLVEVLGLMRGADTVELKVTVGEGQRYGTAQALGIDPLDGRIRQVFFFDTPDLRLDAAGVVVRARRIQDAAADTVVKLRPVDPADIPKKLRREPTFGVEVDAMPGGYVCSASFKGPSTNEEVKRAAMGEIPISKLFSKGQRAFYADHAPDGLGLDDLSILGPINLVKLKFRGELGRKIVAELWMYPDGARILELSTKCAPGEAFQVAAEERAYLESNGLDLTGKQQTKTKAALGYFSRELQAAAAPPPES
ncbi:MAG TPA: adenylate cyclase [Actinomycetota bacterium]|nr:adenylate cyclase [Actinomycetota bacterium]